MIMKHQHKWLRGVFCLLLCSPGLAAAADNATKSSQIILRQSNLAPAQMQAIKPIQQFQFKPLQAKVLAKLRPIKPDNNKPQGPDVNASLSLSDVISDTALLESIQEKVGWDSHLIFQDKAVSNLFYYIPRELLLIRDKDGYHLSAQYNAAQEQGQASVMLTAEVAAPHQTGDIALLKALLAQALQLSSADAVNVKAFPALNMQINLQALGAGLAIAQDRMQVIAPSHLAKPVRLILNLTQDETEAALTQIAHEGLLGSVEIAVGDQQVKTSLRVQYRDYAGNSLGGIDQWLAGGSVEQIQNESAFPLSISSINAYLIKGKELERQQKELKASSAIKPGAKRSFKIPTIKTLFGDGVVFAWFETEQQADCAKCLESIRDEVTRGISASPMGTVNIEVIPAVFSEWDLYTVQLEIRSPYFTPQSNKLENRSLTFTTEANKQQLQLYFPDNKGVSPLLFRYRINAVRNDGKQISSEEWHDSHEMGLILGSYQLSPMLSEE
ncbi:MAG: hypothetical protein JXA04_00210 [Gammaproteobacteria bacterium]|nr:hypothetical protein [Gammaproteobacteria bacterium]